MSEWAVQNEEIGYGRNGFLTASDQFEKAADTSWISVTAAMRI